ncbi:YhgE/Pip family protein [Cohnella abietis]|uniref:Phage infection protein n=1 Tax=Cohnella abietis TaxID=2507935 RepID=A0A3T1D7X4_9BACL|nr:YhgE/Pip domain-containing protein [Cohnella abietis]BBI34187.1 phage infection protein [Cohnella abietis]
MHPFHVFKQSFRYFIHKPMLVISFIAVAFIPTLYSGFLIRGTWNPYGQLSNLPVAIVNMDQGASYEGKSLNVGKDFVDELSNNNSFAWSFVNKEEADQGMKGNHYYASITIPANFSQDIATLSSDNPKQASILFESNSYYNFVAGQISENVSKELKERLSHNVTEAYSRSIFTQFESLSSGLSLASKGSNDLNTGAVQLNDGIVKFSSSLAELAKGAGTLDSSVGLLKDGAGALQTGVIQLNNGASELSLGAKKLAAAGIGLQEGALKTEQGSTAITAGIKSSKAAADQLTAGLQSTVTGSGQLNDGLGSSLSSIDELSTGSAQVATGLQKAMDSNESLASDPQLQKLLAASQEVAKGTKELLSGQKKLQAASGALYSGQQKLLAGSQKLSTGQDSMLRGVTELQTGQKQIYEGLKEYNSKFNQITTGSSKLAEGAKQLNVGATKLHTGLGQMVGGVGKVASGASQLNAATAPLGEGAGKLVNGAHELASKLTEAADKTSMIKANDKMIQMLAQPVAMISSNERKVTIYGNGIAPYFISMALFAGALVFTTIISARSSIVDGASGISVFVSKTLTFACISLAQSLIAVTILVYILGLKVQSVPLFYLYTALAGFTFMFMVQAIVTWLDLPGRFVVLLIMIFQLASSAGTFPLELLPGWAKAMNPWLPMTYTIRGFRDVISSGNYNDMWSQVARFAPYLLVSLILTFVYFISRGKGKVEEEQLMPVKL